jgi:GNAT superfamily N-acetyltransferase
LLRETLRKAAMGEALSAGEAERALGEIMSGTANPVVTAALLTALRVRGESVGEIVGFARAVERGGVELKALYVRARLHGRGVGDALLAAAIGATEIEPFAGIGVRARLAEITPGELHARVREATGGREPLAFLAGPDPVRTIGIVSGGAAKNLDDAIAAGLDAFVTGEPREPVMNDAREAGIHFLAAGHYATETFGVRALGERLAAEFGIRHVFADVPNPV